MATSLLDRLGLGNDRAVANARRAALDRQEEDRIVALLVADIVRHEALAASTGPVSRPRSR